LKNAHGAFKPPVFKFGGYIALFAEASKKSTSSGP
jgi:hypothetical protein